MNDTASAPHSTCSFKPASFGTRFVARFVDSLIALFIAFIIGLAIIPIFNGDSKDNIELINALLQTSVFITYEIFFTIFYEATPGKKMRKIKIVNEHGNSVTGWQLFGRYWAYVLSGVLLCIGHLMAAVRSDKRALHDLIAGTRVIYMD